MQKVKISTDRILRFPKYMPPGRLLKTARTLVGLRRETLAYRMGIDINTLIEYENDMRPIPNIILLKIFLFGLDMWSMPHDTNITAQ